MSKLYELLQGVIQKVNKSVSTDAQQLTDEQKLQVKTNLGISDTVTSAIPDWNQNDQDGEGYIANRTHYTELSQVSVVQKQITYTSKELLGEYEWSSDDDTIDCGDHTFKEGDSITVCVNGKSETVVVEIAGDTSGDERFHFSCETMNVAGYLAPVGDINTYDRKDRGWIEYWDEVDPNATTTLNIEILANTLVCAKKLDEMFLPDSQITSDEISNLISMIK